MLRRFVLRTDEVPKRQSGGLGERICFPPGGNRCFGASWRSAERRHRGQSPLEVRERSELTCRPRLIEHAHSRSSNPSLLSPTGGTFFPPLSLPLCLVREAGRLCRDGLTG